MRAPMAAEFRRTNSARDTASIEELERNLSIIANARREVEAAVRANPGNTRLVSLMIEVHQ
jgi:hypothetical protein